MLCYWFKVSLIFTAFLFNASVYPFRKYKMAFPCV